MIIKAAKRILNSDKICRSYSDLNFGVTFFGTQCIYVSGSNCNLILDLNSFNVVHSMQLSGRTFHLSTVRFANT